MTYDHRVWANGQIMPDRHIDCCRWQHLIYVRTLKCASEFFWRNFTETAGWQPMAWHDIDWQQHTVFSYVMDPIVRRQKGIAEWVVINHLQDKIQDQGFVKLLANTPCLDEHSASINLLYGDRVHQMHWLPVLQDHAVAIKATDQWLEQQGHARIPWNKNFVHDTKQYMGHIYDRLREVWDLAELNPVSVRFFQDDIELWIRTKKIHGLHDSD